MFRSLDCLEGWDHNGSSIYVFATAKRKLLSLTQQQPTETGKIEIKVVFVSSNQGQRIDLPFCNNAFLYFVNTNFLRLDFPQSIENTQMRVCISRRVEFLKPIR